MTPGRGADTSFITVAPDEDVAYFGGRTPDRGCVAKATLASIDECAFSLRTLLSATSLTVVPAQVSEDGAMLYVAALGTDSEKYLYEVILETMEVQGIRPIDSYATCPDNSVVLQDGTISQRRAGGVTSDVRLGFGGGADMGCPLKPL